MVHRFDGGSMDQRWTTDGVTMEEKGFKVITNDKFFAKAQQAKASSELPIYLFAFLPYRTPAPSLRREVRC